MKFTLITLGMLLSGASFAQYCTSGGPTSTQDSNVQLVKIVGQGDSIVHIGCPGVIGVENLTNLSTTLNATSSYTLNVQFGTCNGNYLGAGEVWIDFDQNNVFDLGESIGTWVGTPPVPLSVFNFTVPATARNGATRMRVMQHEAGGNPPLDPCASFAWGSVMDFTIVITGGINCTGYVGDDRSDPKIVPSFPYTDNGDNSYCYTNRNPTYPSPDVFYRVIPSAQSASIRASLCGSTFDTFLSVTDETGTVLAFNDDAAGCAPQSELVFSTVGVDTAYVIVEGWGMQMGAYALNLTEDLVGINEYQANQFSVYPNPAQNYFVVTGNVTGEILITDVVGNTVDRLSNYHGEQISTAKYKPGLYFIQFSYGGNHYSKKITIAE